MTKKKNTPKKSKPKAKKKPNNSPVSRALAVDNSHEWHAPIYTAEYVGQQRDIAHHNGKIEAEDRYFLWGMLVSSIAWVFVVVIVWVFHG